MSDANHDSFQDARSWAAKVFGSQGSGRSQLSQMSPSQVRPPISFLLSLSLPLPLPLPFPLPLSLSMVLAMRVTVRGMGTPEKMRRAFEEESGTGARELDGRRYRGRRDREGRSRQAALRHSSITAHHGVHRTGQDQLKMGAWTTETNFFSCHHAIMSKRRGC